MTEQEQAVLQKLAEAWNEFLKLEQCHNDEVHDFRFHIHALQAMVLARPKIDQQLNLKPPERTTVISTMTNITV